MKWVYRRTLFLLTILLATAGGTFLFAGAPATTARAAGPNLALNRPAVASSIENSTLTADRAVDGDTSTRWSSAFSDNQWIYVDLGQEIEVSQVVLQWEAAYGTSYHIQLSNDASNWTTVYSEWSGDGGTDTIDLPAGSRGRYVRMYGLTRATPYGFSLWEFEVYGNNNLALNRPAVASSIEDSTLTADRAVDGDASTRWSSVFSDNQWIYVDLGQEIEVSQVVLQWEAAYGTSYHIQLSNDASNWTTVYSEWSGDGGTDTIGLPAGSRGRYVRMYGLTRATPYGFSLWEFEVYGEGTSTPPGDGYQLVWSDEFDGSSLNLNNWSYEYGGHGWGNNELQYYTDAPKNVRVESGRLIIEAHEGGDGHQCWYGDCRYTSARIVTKGKQEFTYGKIEARIKLPAENGLWPAFWMLGNDIDSVNWPQCGEIDIMENIGFSDWSSAAIHGPGYSGGGSVGDRYFYPSGQDAKGWHVYTVEWEADRLTWYVDGNEFHSVDRAWLEANRGEWVFDHPFFIILNFAVDGDYPRAYYTNPETGEGLSPEALANFPHRLEVDWVRVYQQ